MKRILLAALGFFLCTGFSFAATETVYTCNVVDNQGGEKLLGISLIGDSDSTVLSTSTASPNNLAVGEADTYILVETNAPLSLGTTVGNKPASYVYHMNNLLRGQPLFHQVGSNVSDSPAYRYRNCNVTINSLVNLPENQPWIYSFDIWVTNANGDQKKVKLIVAYKTTISARNFSKTTVTTTETTTTNVPMPFPPFFTVVTVARNTTKITGTAKVPVVMNDIGFSLVKSFHESYLQGVTPTQNVLPPVEGAADLGYRAYTVDSVSVDNNKPGWSMGCTDLWGRVSAAKKPIVASGANHSLYLAGDGSVWSWGSNSSGQLGDGTQADRPLPKPIPALVGKLFKSVICGGDQSFAIADDGTLWSWGNNEAGLLGNGSYVNQALPAQVTAFGQKKIKSFACGQSFAVALAEDGTVWGWGLNKYDELGNGNEGKQSKPVKIAAFAGKKIQSIAVGFEYALALDTDGKIWSWGYNYYGQLGDGTTTNRSAPVQVSALSGKKVVSIACGLTHSMALDSDGKVWTWGENGFGQLGDNSTVANRPAPLQNSALSGKQIKSINAGEFQSFAIATDNTVWAWGWNALGQLGDGSTTNRLAPVQVSALDSKSLQSIASGYNHTMAISEDGTVYSWGYNAFGQLGYGMEWPSSAYQRTPLIIDDLANSIQISAGGEAVYAKGFTVSVQPNGSVYANGINSSGELGTGGTTNRLTPTQVPGVSNVKAVSAGTAFTLALQNNGTLRSWGDNTYYQLGYGSSGADFLSDIKQVSAGGFHAMALSNTGLVYTWGYNSQGELGDLQYYDGHNRPNPLAVLTGCQAVAAGAYHSIALTESGQVYSWGWNNNYQCGSAATISASYTDTVIVPVYVPWPPFVIPTPQQVTAYRTEQFVIYPTVIPSLQNIKAISGGYNHSMALGADGKVWVWGNNQFGQYGNNSTAIAATPTQVPNLSDIVAISAGYNFCLALSAAGDVYFWGLDQYGESGTGASGSKLKPTKITGLSNIVSIEAGGNHAFATDRSGNVWGWGKSDSGQLGLNYYGLVKVKLPPPVGSIEPIQNLGPSLNQTSVGLKAKLVAGVDSSTWQCDLFRVNNVGDASILASESQVEGAVSFAGDTCTVSFQKDGAIVDGWYRLTAKVKDLKGLTATYSSPLFYVDSSGPRLTTNLGSDQVYLNQTKEIKAQIDPAYSDPDGVFMDTYGNVIYQFSLDNGANWADGGAYTPVGEGNFTVMFRARDNIGNFGTCSLAVVYDRNAPVVTPFGVDGSALYLKSGQTIGFTATDDNSGLMNPSWDTDADKKQYLADIGQYQVGYSVTGIRNLRVSVSDRAGNTGVWTGTAIVDDKAPVFLAKGSIPNFVGSGQILVWTIIDDLSGLRPDSVFINLRAKSTGAVTGLTPQLGGADGDLSRDVTVALPEGLSGEYVLTIEAGDKSGNANGVQINLTVDSSQPIVGSGFINTYKEINGNKVFKSGPVLTLTGQDGQAGFGGNPQSLASCALLDEQGNEVTDGLTMSVTGNGAAVSATVSVNKQGSWRLRLKLKDLVGNESVSDSEPFVVDATTPTGILNGPFRDTGGWYALLEANDESGIDEAISSVKVNSAITYLRNMTKQAASYRIALPAVTTVVVTINLIDQVGNQGTMAAQELSLVTQGPVIGFVSPEGLLHPWASGQIWYRNSTVGYAELLSTIRVSDRKTGAVITDLPVSFTAVRDGDNFTVTLDKVGDKLPDGDANWSLVATVVDQYLNSQSTTGRSLVIDTIAPELKWPDAHDHDVYIPSSQTVGMDLVLSADATLASPGVIATAAPEGLQLDVTQSGQSVHVQAKRAFGDATDFQISLWSVDKSGNRSAMQPWNLHLDDSAPNVSGLRVWDGSGVSEIGALEFLSQPTTRLSVLAAEDRIPGYEWEIVLSAQAQGLGTIDWSQAISQGGKQWLDSKSVVTIANPGSGLRFAYVRARDKAGNLSAAFERVLRSDTTTPAAPRISSTTHARWTSAEDSSPLTQGVFQIRAGSTGPSGVAAFRYRLLRVDTESGETREMTAANTASNQLSLDLSQESGEGAFRLLVRTVAANGLIGEEAIYDFRVDTNPPAKLTIRSDSHPVASVYYRGNLIRFAWNQPADFSGVRRYGWALLGGDPQANYDIEAAKSGTFIYTDNTYFDIPVNTIGGMAGQYLTGNGNAKIIMLVFAEDYAGNKQWAYRQVLIDNQAPRLADEASFKVAASAANRNVVADIGQILDNVDEAGVISVSTQLARFDGTKFVPMSLPQIVSGNEAARFVWAGVPDTGLYQVLVNMYDNAGNRREYVQYADMSGLTPVLPAVSRQVSETLGSFTVEGSETLLSGQVSESDLHIRLDQGSPLMTGDGKAYPIIALQRDADGNAFLAFNDATDSNKPASWIWNVSARKAAGTGLALGTTSLELFGAKVTIGAHAVGNLNPVEVNFANISIGPGPQYYWNAAARDIGLGTTGASSDGLWAIRGIQRVGLWSEGWFAEGSRWDTHSLAFTAYVRQPDGSPNFAVNLGSAQFKASALQKAGISEKAFLLENHGARFLIEQFGDGTPGAELQANRLVVYRAKLLMEDASGAEVAVATLQNFAIDGTGKFSQLAQYRSTAGEAVDLGYGTLSLGSVSLGATGVIASDASLVLVNGQTIGLRQTGLLTVGGLREGEVAGSFEGNFFGYRVTADGGRLSGGVVSYDQAHIYLLPYQNEAVPLNDFRVRLTDGQLPAQSEAPDWSGSTHSGPIELATAYGESGVTASGLILDRTGVRADLTVSLPENWGGSSLAAGRFYLNSDGTISKQVDSGVTAAATPNGFTATVGQAWFAADGMVVDQLKVAMPSGDQLAFGDLHIDHAGIIHKKGVYAASLDYACQGWVFGFEALGFGSDGPEGTPDIAMPQAMGGESRRFGRTVLLAEGGYRMDASAGEVQFEIYGWSAISSNLRLVGDKLELEQVRLPLPGIMADEAVGIGTVEFSQEGEITSPGSPQYSEFRGTNGFLVKASQVKVEPDGLAVTGKVYLPEILGGDGISFGPGSIRVGADGAVVAGDTETASTNQTVTVGGWPVKLSRVRFDQEGLKINQAMVSPAGLGNIMLPDFVLYSDGSFKVAGEGFEPIDLNLFGVLNVAVNRLTFSDNGISIDANVAFPEAWQVPPVYFDALTLHPDGQITCTTRIPQLSFESDALGLSIDLRDLSFNSDGFIIDEAVFRYTKGDFADKSLTVRGFAIKPDGSFGCEQIVSDPLDIWGYKLSFTSFSLDTTKRTFSFGGGLQLADDFVIPQLAGYYIALDKCTLGFDGNLVDFQVRLDEELRFPLFDNWFISTKSIAISRQTLSIGSASLELPPGYGVTEVAVNGIAIDLVSGAVQVGDINFIPALTLSVEGIDFSLTKLNISKENGLIFAGNLTIPQKTPSGVEYPSVLQGLNLEVEKFQIKPDWSIGEIKATAKGLRGPLLSDQLMLDGGEFGIDTSNGKAAFKIGGKITLGSAFPSGLAGAQLKINNLTYDIAHAKLENLNVEFVASKENPLSINLLDSATVDIGRIGLGKGSGDEILISVAGDIKLGSTFPSALKDATIRINDFTIDSNGTIKSFDAGLDLGDEVTLLDDVYLEKVRVRAQIINSGPGLREFRLAVNGGVRLGDGFPAGLNGITMKVLSDPNDPNSMGIEWDGRGVLKKLNIGIDMPDNFKIFDSVLVENGHVGIRQLPTDPAMLVTVAGNIVLPDDLPKGLAGLSINIREFSIWTNGNLNLVNVGFSDLNVNVFDILSLVDFGMNINNDPNDKNRLVFRIFGGVTLPSSLPGSLSGLTVNINDFTFDNRGKVDNFSASLGTPIRIDLFDSLKLAITKLDLDLEGLTLAASLEIPSNSFLGTSGNYGVDLLRMQWNGKIDKLSVLLGNLSLKVAGFTIQANKITVGTEGVAMDSASLSLPFLEGIGVNKIELIKPRFDTNGQFHGAIGVDQIAVSLSGFELQFVHPSFDFEHSALAFDLARIKAPEFLANIEAKLEGATISPAGLDFVRASFSMGPVSIGSVLNMRHLGMSITKIRNGTAVSYEVGGDISVVLKGASSMEISGLIRYGDGKLKQLFFSFYSESGISLGVLTLNGIRGGFNTGAPNEVPLPYRNLFERDGFRLQLGVTISVVRPAICRIDGDFFIDVYNGSFAVVGKASIFYGLVYAEVGIGASFTKRVFLMHTYFDMFHIVKGTSDLYIFDYRGTPLINGMASVSVVFTTGCIINYSLDIWFIHIRILIPWFDWEVASGGAEFGTFQNGMQGVRAYCTLFGIFSGDIMLERGGFHLSSPDTHIIKPEGF